MPLVRRAWAWGRWRRARSSRSRVSVATAVLAAILVCCTPTSARGGPVFSFGLPLGEVVEFGSASAFSAQSQLFSPTCDGLASLIHCSSLDGLVEIVSGPLVSVITTPDAFGQPLTSTYQFGAGMLSLQAEWGFPGGGTGHGMFSAPIADFTFSVGEQFPVAPEVCCDAKLLLGAGLFDAALAEYLGVQPQTIGGVFLLQLDGIVGAPGDPQLFGFYNGSNVAIDVVAVPEPGALALAAIAAALTWTRRRRESRRQKPA